METWDCVQFDCPWLKTFKGYDVYSMGKPYRREIFHVKVEYIIT